MKRYHLMVFQFPFSSRPDKWVMACAFDTIIDADVWIRESGVTDYALIDTDNYQFLQAERTDCDPEMQNSAISAWEKLGAE